MEDDHGNGDPVLCSATISQGREVDPPGPTRQVLDFPAAIRKSA